MVCTETAACTSLLPLPLPCSFDRHRTAYNQESVASWLCRYLSIQNSKPFQLAVKVRWGWRVGDCCLCHKPPEVRVLALSYCQTTPLALGQCQQVPISLPTPSCSEPVLEYCYICVILHYHFIVLCALHQSCNSIQLSTLSNSIHLSTLSNSIQLSTLSTYQTFN